MEIGPERANQLTHGFGLLLAIIGSIYLVHHFPTIQCIIYTCSLISVYLFSTLSHSFIGEIERRFHALDQISIFLLVAGSFTAFIPSSFILFRPALVLFLMWSAAFVGIFYRVFCGKVHPTFYILMGWIPIIAWPEMKSLPFSCSSLIFLGGGFYTVGTYFLMNDTKKPYYHAIWHSFVILASICHYFAVYLYYISA